MPYACDNRMCIRHQSCCETSSLLNQYGQMQAVQQSPLIREWKRSQRLRPCMERGQITCLQTWPKTCSSQAHAVRQQMLPWLA